MNTMLAARLHEIGGPLLLEQIPIPEPRPTDVLVAVKACGVVPNLKNVLTKWPEWFPYLPLPKLPAIFGLDPAGVVTRVGSQVHSIRAGERVYVNPARGCGSCRACRSGEIVNCRGFTFQGYFGRGPLSQAVFDAYPYGGMSEYITAPQSALVRLPDNVSFEQAARFGYLGTAYAAIRKAGAGPGRTMLVNGIGGALGLCAALVGLATGVTTILGTGRNQALLDRVKALAPARIEVFAVGKRPVHEWAMEVTGNEGVDAVIDTLPPGSLASAMLDALRAAAGRARGRYRRRGRNAAAERALDDGDEYPAYWVLLVLDRRGTRDGGDGSRRNAESFGVGAPAHPLEKCERGAFLAPGRQSRIQ